MCERKGVCGVYMVNEREKEGECVCVCVCMGARMSAWCVYVGEKECAYVFTWLCVCGVYECVCVW